MSDKPKAVSISSRLVAVEATTTSGPVRLFVPAVDAGSYQIPAKELLLTRQEIAMLAKEFPQT